MHKTRRHDIKIITDKQNFRYGLDKGERFVYNMITDNISGAIWSFSAKI